MSMLRLNVLKNLLDKFQELEIDKCRTEKHLDGSGIFQLEFYYKPHSLQVKTFIY